MVTSMAMKSAREYRQVRIRAGKSTSVDTATIIVAANVATGSMAMAGVSASVATAIPIAVKAPAAGVWAPASKFTTEREKPPVTGIPPANPAPRLAAPRPISS